MGRLERKLDLELITKIENGWQPRDIVLPLEKQKHPRHSSTYRAARRNASIRGRKTVRQ